MMRIEEITKIDKKHIALMDTSSISFMQGLQTKGIKTDSILKDYELILIPKWVLVEIEDSDGRAEYVQSLIDTGYPIYCIAEETYSDLTGYEEGNLYQIVLASASLIARVRAYLRRYVDCKDPLDMEAYAEWIKKQGHVEVRRIQVSDKLLKMNQPLSRLWINGVLGGVPELL